MFLKQVCFKLEKFVMLLLMVGEDAQCALKSLFETEKEKNRNPVEKNEQKKVLGTSIMLLQCMDRKKKI
jgi:hypothetical protein